MQFLQTTLKDSFKIEFTLVANYITKLLIATVVLLMCMVFYEQHYHVFFEERRNDVKTLLRLYAGGASEHRFTYAYYAHWFWSFPALMGGYIFPASVATVVVLVNAGYAGNLYQRIVGANPASTISV